ncbi:hypothetical protein DXG03_003135 [Asterophora parasitica]|uniref:Uncharacterized protein n=1 Tax=Asterophora parasitica TaxID=117018 RepID=A0A9P7KGD6_9AGAR|nr:hypothetical protein DXG03_003135 [Asterophora parasitica]
MSDYDDYFTDDICFDDQTLAILDHEEQKYLNQAVKTPAPPPAKRQKTDSDWSDGVGARGGASKAKATVDYLPEICLSLDGNYGVQRNANISPVPHRPPPTKNISSARAHINQPPPQTSRQPSAHIQRAPPPVTSRTGSTSSYQHQSHVRPPSGSQGRLVGFQRPNSRSNTSQAATGPRPSSIPPLQVPSPSVQVPNQVNPPHELEKQLRELQQKLQEVSEENKRIQLDLKEAMGARMAKEGEVTVLRKNAEKLSQEHAAQLANMKLAREEAEVKQARMQKEMREEVERLKTQFTFKESARRAPPSARPKKIYKELPPGIMSTPSQFRRSIYQETASGPRDPFEETMTPRPSFGNTKDVRKSPQIKRTSMLPGFENAFGESTPLRPSRVREQFIYDVLSQRRHREPVSPTTRQRPSTAVDETFIQASQVPDADGDVEMPLGIAEDDGDVVLEEDVDMDEEFYSVEAPDWKWAMLLGAPVTPNLGDGLSETYLTLCTRVLEVMANTSKADNWKFSVECLARSLISMVPILRAANSVSRALLASNVY